MDKAEEEVGGKKMKSNHQRVLDVLVKDFDECEGGAFFCFKALSKRTKLDRRSVRLACRYLKRKGLARFGTGLSNNDGEFYGSGYSATEQAIHQASRQKAGL